MNTSSITAPPWLTEGAEVICYSTGGAGTPASVVRTTIRKVAGKSFTVEAEREPRFPLDRLTARCGTGWSAYTRHVVPLDSDEARGQLAAMALRMAISVADAAYDAWRRSRSPEHLAALIGALREVEQLEIQR